ncbi:glycosyltransferase family 4 protein [Pseudomonas sp.]|uniref:glycosyltransferase family 4 protein n=1 Tax=Pseudomonas sp. TaxID=306 RepID=UPI001994F527|nr:glycosyltransferase family 4 protein [Pseudomonas sp.]MBC6627142.1 glycosyltransferase family 4 protein [Pseudomonas sp.]
MKKVIVIFHDNNIKSGATASMLSIVQYWKTHNLIEIEAIIPKDKGSLGKALGELHINYQIIDYDMVRYHVDDNIITRALKYFRGWYRFSRDIVFCLKNKNKFSHADYIYSNTSSIYFGVILAKMSKIKHIWHFREFGFEDQNCKHIIGDNNFYSMANNLSYKIIVISKSLENKIGKYIESDKIAHIYNGIDSSSIYTKKKLFLDKRNPLKLLIVGAVIPNKGQEFVIEALGVLKKKNIPFKLGIAGQGKSSYLEHLKEKCRILNIEDNVVFHGFVSNKNEILSDYDISVIPSKSEAFGRVTLESMISGLLVVCSDSGANKELVSDVNGYVYLNDNIESLVSILEKIYNEDEDIKLKKVEMAKDFSAKFTVGKCAKEIHQVMGGF